MSPKTFSIAAGLAALGLAWNAPLVAAGRIDDPAPETNRSIAPAAESSERVLLLYDGRILRGKLTETDDGYLLAQKLGELRIRRREVEKIFDSLQDVYRYKAERLPQGDPEEHLKFAQWCFMEKLEQEARTELKKVLELQPDSRQARAMLFSIDAAAERLAKQKNGADAAVARTGVDVPIGADGKPRALPAEIYKVPRGRSRDPNRLGPPTIFNLSPPLAVKRYQEFVTYVHPELQRQCASCHNERSTGKFVLLQARDRRMATDPLLLRTNLDAVLRLVNPDNPSRSELLLSSVTDHPQINRPILSGPNHPTYRVFSTWAQRLKSSTTDEDVVSTSATVETGAKGSGDVAAGFAVDRVGSAQPLAPVNSRAQSKSKPATAPSGPEVRHPGVPSDADFRTVSPLIDPNNAGPLLIGDKQFGGIPVGASGSLPTLPGQVFNGSKTPNPKQVGPTDPRAAALPPNIPLINPFKPDKDDATAQRKPRKFKLNPAELDKVMRASRGD